MGWDKSLQLSKECEPDSYFPYISLTSVCSHRAESQTICIILWVCEGLQKLASNKVKIKHCGMRFAVSPTERTDEEEMLINVNMN